MKNLSWKAKKKRGPQGANFLLMKAKGMKKKIFLLRLFLDFLSFLGF